MGTEGTKAAPKPRRPFGYGLRPGEVLDEPEGRQATRREVDATANA